MNGKYRVYDKQEKRYVTDEWMWVIRPDGTLAYVDHDDVIGYLDAIAEYSTGLPDKNGREIFEGDIVRSGYTNHLGEFYNNGTVVYVENDGSFEIANDECYLNRLTRNMVVQRNIEVIRSIHDTPKRGQHDD